MGRGRYLNTIKGSSHLPKNILLLIKKDILFPLGLLLFSCFLIDIFAFFSITFLQ